MRSNDPYRLPKLNELAGREVAPITHRAHSPAALACKNRTDLQTFHAHPLKFCGDFLVDVLVRFDNFFPFVHRVGDRLTTDASDNSLAEIDHFLVAFVDRAYHDAIYRSAIFRIDNDVLRRVHQFPRQIAGVGSFESCVGKTFARAVSGNKIFQHTESLAEVGRDRTLNDFARRFGHQTAHASELTHLLAITARAGIDH